MKAQLDNYIRLPKSELPDDLFEHLKDELEIVNQERVRAKKEHRYGWKELPKKHILWDEENGTLLIPRGFRWRLEQVLDIEFDDRRTFEQYDDVFFPVLKPYEHQATGRDELLNETQGIIEAPPASGKTIMVMDTIYRAGTTNNLIIIDKINLADQWKERAEQYMGDQPGAMKVGIIGDKVWDEQPITIATNQTLWSRREELDKQDWWSKWSLVCLDECHHQTADTFRLIMQRFPAYYRFGVSATPDKNSPFEIAEAVLGDVLYKVSRQKLWSKGILIQPTVHEIPTNFSFDFHSTMKVEPEDCPFSWCKKQKEHIHRNNYHKLIDALVKNTPRNNLIASKIIEEGEHHNLVLSDRLEHFDRIEKALRDQGYTGDVFRLTGKESRKKRKEVINAIGESEGSAVFSTIANEALDIPKLDRAHLTFPTRNIRATEQKIGRIERTDKGKRDAKVFEYIDPIGVILNQYDYRYRHLYIEQGYPIKEAI